MTRIVLDYPPLTLAERWKLAKTHGPAAFFRYLLSFLPILKWICRYNFSWMLQDVIAGITVGLLLVPQGIAYAKVANLEPQYGLYTSFVGAVIYCLFGTSKDISIGPITVVSLLVGEAVTKVTTEHPDVTGGEVAVCLSVIAGCITLLMGMARMGILVDFISGPAIAGYMSGSAITIGLGQWPKMFGMTEVDTHQPPYLIFIDFFANIPKMHIDAVFGALGLVVLYVIKFGTGHLAAKLPRLQKPLFFMGIMRSGLIVIIGTIISFGINHGGGPSPFKIIKQVPAGFDAIGIPHIRWDVLTGCMDVLPSIVLILVLEHVSVAKSFGRLAGYDIQPDQEIVAIGVSNILGSFFGAYPATGAFSRTAVMARSGAKTPLAGVFTGTIVVMALYVLTPCFYFIPEAVLAAVVVHAVSDLISGPAYVMELYRTSLLELVVFVLGVVLTCFIDVETGIYASVGLSLGIMLLRLARPPVTPLVRCPLQSQHFPGGLGGRNPSFSTLISDQHYIYVDEADVHFSQTTDPMPPGILVVRLAESILYPNAGQVAETLTQLGKTRTRSGHRVDDPRSLLWCDRPTQVHRHQNDEKRSSPLLGAIVLDMAAVHRMDSTGLQALVCVRTTLEAHAGQAVEWHFTGLQNAKIRQDLLAFGFGSLSDAAAAELHISTPIPPQMHEPLASPMPLSPSPKELPLPPSSTSQPMPMPPSSMSPQPMQGPPSVSRAPTSSPNHTAVPMPRSSSLKAMQQRQRRQQIMQRGSIYQQCQLGKEEKTILESWRATAFLDREVHRFSSHISLFDPMEVDIDPYYASINVSQDPHDQLPVERYPCFHWDVDTAVRAICDRWHSKKSMKN
ncbi:sulfate transporter family-domain-containing protein [Gongronella butleri]|nr:sulfate transporter family-domain-containing protein [Gongronella butleri]